VRATGLTNRGSGPPGSCVACQRPSVGLGQQQYVGSSVSSMVGIVTSSPNGGRASNWLYSSSSTTSSTPTIFLVLLLISWIWIRYIENLCDIFGKNKWLFSVTKKSEIDISHTILVGLHSIWESDPLAMEPSNFLCTPTPKSPL
jgi:hypothetical protein